MTDRGGPQIGFSFSLQRLSCLLQITYQFNTSGGHLWTKFNASLRKS